MSIRFRKSMKLLPGVRLNFSKETVGLSFGVPGARYTMNSKGRRTVSTGIPGTGLYNVDTLNSGKRSSGGRSSPATSSQETDTWQAPQNCFKQTFLLTFRTSQGTKLNTSWRLWLHS